MYWNVYQECVSAVSMINVHLICLKHPTRWIVNMSPIGIHVTVSWSVCLSVWLSRSCIVLKRQKISISFAYYSPVSLPDCVKIWLTSVYLSPQILLLSDPSLLIWASETFDGKLRPNSDFTAEVKHGVAFRVVILKDHTVITNNFPPTRSFQTPWNDKTNR